MNTEEKKPSIYGTMQSILLYINSPKEQNNLAGNLAAIRNSVGKKYEDATEVWPILFPLIPQEFLGNNSLTYEEKALLVTLQLYAIGQQGSNKTESDNSNNISFGYSLRQIKDKNSTSLERRFNTMLTSITFDEFTYHLRQLFKLGKSNNKFSVNFPKLADDLFRYQKGRSKQICLKWAKDYYRSINKDNDGQDLTSEENNNLNENKEAV